FRYASASLGRSFDHLHGAALIRMPLAHEKHAPPQSDRRIVSLTLRSEQRGQLQLAASLSWVDSATYEERTVRTPQSFDCIEELLRNPVDDFLRRCEVVCCQRDIKSRHESQAKRGRTQLSEIFDDFNKKGDALQRKFSRERYMLGFFGVHALREDVEP